MVERAAVLSVKAAAAAKGKALLRKVGSRAARMESSSLPSVDQQPLAK
jgi:hypothetical protein